MLLWLALPAVAWIANFFLPCRLHPAILFVSVGLTCYLLMTITILTEFSGYEREFTEFDLNGDGELDREELTPAAIDLQDKIAGDTGRVFGPIFAAPITVIWVTINFALLYAAEFGFKRIIQHA